jgi:RimJ/RimL family protein N-acetyltransferase
MIVQVTIARGRLSQFRQCPPDRVGTHTEGDAMLFDHLDMLDVPRRLETHEFILRPIVAADVELDYAAVMESKEYLRPWEQTGWPADDFTLEDDLEDVAMLEERHNARHAFTWTLMSPDESECLGCVYLMPPDARSYRESRIDPIGDARWGDYGGLVNFWVRTSRLGSGIDSKLLRAIRQWFAEHHELGRLLYVTNEEVTQQVELFESAGLQRRFTISKPSQTGAYLAYE